MSTPGTPPYPGQHGHPPYGAPGGYGPPQGPPGGGYGPPPPGGYGPQGPAGYPGYGPPQKKSNKGLIIGSVAALLVALGLGALLLADDAQAGEVFLVPAASAGPDPFSTTPFASAPDPSVAQPAAPASGAVSPSGNGAIQATSGAKPGLYGGSLNNASCDPGQMVSFLQQNPDKAQAWVDALNADPSVRLRDGQPLTVANLPQYVAGLTSIVLTSDTRVTNHGFKNGRANQLQAVLQKGSAVMVDAFGVPRVKCYCGNPLLPPKPTRGTPRYEGPRWPDFNPDQVTVITPPPTPIEVFVVCDPRDLRQCFQQPQGGVPNQPYAGELTPVPPSAEAPPQAAISNAPPPEAPRASPPPAAPPVDAGWGDGDPDAEDIDESQFDDGYDPVPDDLWNDEGAGDEEPEECVAFDEAQQRGIRVDCSECAGRGGTLDCAY